MELFFIILLLLLVFRGEISSIKAIIKTNVRVEEARSNVEAKKELSKLVKEKEKLTTDKSIDELYEELLK